MSDPAVVSAESLEARGIKTRRILFGLLFVVSSIPLLPPFANKITVPDKPLPSVMDFYSSLMEVPNGSTVLVETDWTNSTRGENGGQFEALMRILMRKHCKAAMYSMDPQAPKVASDEIDYLNSIRGKDEPKYVQWNDYVSLGYYANAEATTNALAVNLRTAFAGKKDVDTKGVYSDVFLSPVLQNVHTIKDVPILVLVTGSSTFTVVVQRLSGKVPLIGMVTGVMGPESLNYYNPDQLKGLVVGLKGAFDLETCMEYGINEPPDKPKVVFDGHPPVDKVPGQDFGRGNLYIATLHLALFLLIAAVIAGNVGMIRAKRKGAR